MKHLKLTQTNDNDRKARKGRSDKGKTSTEPFNYSKAAELLSKHPNFMDRDQENVGVQKERDGPVTFQVRSEGVGKTSDLATRSHEELCMEHKRMTELD